MNVDAYESKSYFVDGKEIKAIPEHIDTNVEIYEPWF